MIEITMPKGWRKGQTVFNFLWWLHDTKGYSQEIGAGGRMADPFHISDKEFDELYAEFLTEYKK